MSITQIPDQLAKLGDKISEVLAAVKGGPAIAQEIAGLKAEAADLKTKLAATEADRDSLKSKLAEKEGEATAAKAEAEKAAAEVKAANEAKEKAEADLKALESNPSKQAVEIAAKAGVKASALPKGDVKVERVATQAEFDAMSFPDRNAFIRSGGKIRG